MGTDRYFADRLGADLAAVRGFRCDRTAGETERGTDLWYAIRIKHFAGNVQFLAAPDGTPLWVSDVEPGSTHDRAAARIHALPDLYRAARVGLPPLADIGYLGAGSGIHVPVRKHPDLPGDIGLDNRTHNKLLRGLRFTGERAMAVLEQRWRALQHVTLNPGRTGAITHAALVLNNTWSRFLRNLTHRQLGCDLCGVLAQVRAPSSSTSRTWPLSGVPHSSASTSPAISWGNEPPSPSGDSVLAPISSRIPKR
ncbi:transposase family protein [Streptomyces sp. NPDC087440]|uniref:transposase family protein n=1 Tax=Streptomyces sp. NPDC087440 TaxID=3365790 RepID=UPI003812BF51